MSAVFFAGCGGPGLPYGNYQVDVLEEEVAALVELGTEKVTTVARHQLPTYVKEGDVLVDGCHSPELTAELRRQVEELRSRFPEHAPGGFEL